MFCKKCGRMIEEDDRICPFCGADECNGDTRGDCNASESTGQNSENENIYQPIYYNCSENQKSRLTAGLLQLFIGSFGIGRFYLGYTGIGIAQIAVSAVTCGIGGFIWGLIDGILILNGKIETDAKGIVLKN